MLIKLRIIVDKEECEMEKFAIGWKMKNRWFGKMKNRKNEELRLYKKKGN